MPFMGTSVMDERVRFCVAVERAEGSMAELCRRFGISRKTGYQTMERWRRLGAAGLAPRSHAPLNHPQAIDGERREMILAVRRKHPTWGPKKVKRYLEDHFAGTIWPAASSIGALYAAEGLSAPRRWRQRVAPRQQPFADVLAPNDTWSIDFKGYFRTGEGRRCDPLTLQDQLSRFLLRLVAMERLDGEHVWSVLEAAFYEFGLPLRLRSDGGSPFASTGAGGLTELAVRLIKAGVAIERIDPGAPQQNGRLERLHLTLQQDTASPPAASLSAQRRSFKAFLKTYNEERPHEALDMATPASCYQASPRLYSGRLVSPEYDGDAEVRRVRQNGEIKWNGERVYISEALVGEPIGLTEDEAGCWQVAYGPIKLGWIGRTGKLERASARRDQGRRSRATPAAASEQGIRESVTHHAG